MPDYVVADTNRAYKSPISSVSWSSIFAGALVAWGVTLIVLIVGAALGFTAISPYDNNSVTPTEFHIATGVFTLVAAILASIFGGYITGRLRTRWVGLHTDEVYFRDTAHGLLSWALATFLGAALIAFSASAIAGGAAMSTTQGTSVTTSQNGTAYASRPAPGSAMTAAPNATTTTEATPADQEAARQIALRTSLWLAASLLAGAFSASLAATWGGAIRDRAAPTV